MKITLKTLTLINFKGIRQLSINFDDALTNIMGDNATGKTTIFDAFTWLFFGKESTDRKDFNIKNTNDTSLNRQGHEVNAVISINDAEISLRRVYSEKWVKKRGEAKTEFTGHETEYFWDDVPLNQGEFNAKVSSIIKENAFKLISNPSYFNLLNWKDRRNILFEVAGTITNADIASGNKKFEELISKLTNEKTLEDYKKQIAGKKKLIKEELETIPTRIDEVLLNMPETVDTAAINKEIKALEKEISTIESSMVNRSEALSTEYEKIDEHQKLIHEARTNANSFKFGFEQSLKGDQDSIQSKRNVFTRQLSSLESELDQLQKQRDRRNDDIKSFQLQIAAKRKDWDAKKIEWDNENNKELVFDEHEFTCPTCKRAYESSDIDGMKLEMENNFKKTKKSKLEKIAAELMTITNQGQLLSEDMKRLEAVNQDEEVMNLLDEIDGVNEQIKSFDEENSKPVKSIDEHLLNHQVYQGLVSKIKELEATLPKVPEVDLTDLKAQKIELINKVDELKKLLSNEDIIKNNKDRIAKLEEDENKLANELAEYEGEEFIIDAFTKKKIETIESRINGKFKYVTFKMFNQQINGGEAETCETMVDNVPYSDLNNAARINAGLDIINALSEHYGVHVPCFIDNAESITRLIEVQSQIIRLVVSEQDKKLRVA